MVSSPREARWQLPWRRRLAAVAAATALSAATGLGAALVPGPVAQAAPPIADEPTTSTTPPEPPEELRQAVERDLGLSWTDYLALGRQAEEAAVLDAQLSTVPGYQGVALEGAEMVVTGSGAAVERAAVAEGARSERPAQHLDADRIDRLFIDEVDHRRTGLLAVAWTVDGWVVTVVDPDARGVLADGSPGRTPRELADANPELEVRPGALATSTADILGGEGWGSGPRMPRCSIGFAAFDPAGRRSMITAGHCSDNGTLRDARWETDPAYSLGTLTFTEFGRPTNSAADPGTDLSVYAGADPGLRPALAGYPGSMRVTGMAAPIVGAPVCTSGRTSRAWQCSTIDEVGPYAVRGPDGPADIRWIHGFSTLLPTQAGDSGAGMVTGLKAVGILSAGVHGVGRSFGSALTGLPAGHSLDVWLNTPTAGAAAGGRVRGRVAVDDSLPPGTTVRIEAESGTTTADVAADGTFTVAAPALPGRLVIASGHSRSTAVDFDPRYGSASTARYCGLRDGGCFQVFIGGSLYWSTASGEHLVRGRILERWGGLAWENGWLRYPTSPEMCGLVAGGCWQVYQGGRLYWSPASDAHPLRGAIGAAWNGTGYERGLLGYPTSGEFCGLRDGGCFQTFQRGSFYWSPRSGAHWVRGAIRDEWGRRGWENGRLGYPVSDEECGASSGGWMCTQRFTGGTLAWTPAGGVRG
ncbi:hypothetical protein [Granulicoccus sp. GXG6511]|uniref:hypothetical protein n=1 Tax=Granulicoccus sp. GXG6511 TaxID=3381351 RepID=UPI003D7CB005